MKPLHHNSNRGRRQIWELEELPDGGRRKLAKTMKHSQRQQQRQECKEAVGEMLDSRCF